MNYIRLLIINILCVGKLFSQEGWEFDIGDYEYQSNMIPIIYKGDEMIGNDDISENGAVDLLAAFDADGMIRGVAPAFPLPEFSPYEGFSFDIQLYANEEGELLTFKFYDASEDVIEDIIETYEFVIDGIDGNVIDPYILNIFIPINGCTDSSACNYDSDATDDDGSCTYPEENYDCDGNCVIEVDCAGECGGDTVFDCTGVCDGNAEVDCAGVCQGSAIIVTVCEDTDDDGLGNPETTSEQCVDGNRDIINDGCDLPDLHLYLNEDDLVYYRTSEAIGGFQFDVDGATVNSASGGDAGTAGFMISTTSTTVLSFSFTGGTIDPDCGTLVELDLVGEGTGLSDIVISDAFGNQIFFTYYINWVNDCSDIYPDCPENFYDCTYDPEDPSTWEVACGGDALEDCTGVCGGSSQVDECGDCGGDNSSCLDCAGVPNGDSAVDNCGTCDNDPSNDNTDDLGCGCFEPGPSGCDNICGSTLENDECGVCDGPGAIYECGCDGYPEAGGETGDEANSLWLEDNGDGTWSVGYNSDYEILGFQLNVDGTTINSAFGGASSDAGFMISASATTVLGFSLSGVAIPTGDGVLVILDLAGTPESLSGIIVSDAMGQDLGFTYDGDGGGEACDCDGNVEDDCGVCNGNNSSCEDCAGVPNGDAELDDCGVCNGGNADDLGCGCFEPGPSGCDNVCGSTLENDDCGVCGGDGTSCLAVRLYFGEITESNIEIWLNNSLNVAGFQFAVSGLNLVGSSGGSSEANGFILSNSSTTVVGFSLTGNVIPPGNNILTNLSFDDISGEDICLSNAIISDPNGNGIDNEVGPCLAPADYFNGGCSDPDGCNFVENTDYDDGSCSYPDENYDCAGDCIFEYDCAGECGGSAVLVTYCEDTDGDGLGNPGSEIQECIEGDRDIGCELPDLNLYLDDGSVYYNSSEAIGGFQFNIDGATVNGASGGDASDAGFMLSTSATTVLGFSFTGGTIGPGCGTLVELDLVGESTGLSNIVLSDPSGVMIPFTYYAGETTELVEDCSDEYPDCPENYYDCNDECGGNAVIDECDVCGGDNSTCSDCAGIPYGANWVSDCGCVDAENSGDDCDDCAGVPYGDTVFDDCGVCGGNGICTAELYIDLIAGWNWISFNVNPEDASLGSILGAVGDDATFISSQSSGAAQNYGAYGWYGGLTSLEPNQMYLLNMAEPGTLTISGIPVDVASTPISLIQGWNWIGYLPQNPGDVGTALASVVDLATFINSQSSGTSTNYGDYGWYGGLTILEPGSGYLLEMSAPGELVYPEFSGTSRLLSENKQAVVLTDKISDWDFHYGDYGFIGTISASIDSREDFDDDVIGVFVGDECRGLAERMYFPFDDNYFYIIQVYSNVAHGEELTFKYYNKANDEVVEYDETLTFESNMIVGDGFNTFSLSREAGSFSQPTAYGISQAYPNPFNPVTNITFGIDQDAYVQVKVYDITGKEIATLADGTYFSGYHNLTWNADNFASGMYFVSLEVDNYIQTQKILLLK